MMATYTSRTITIHYENKVKTLLCRRDVNALMEVLKHRQDVCLEDEVLTDPVPSMSTMGLAVSTGNERVVNAVVAAGFDPNKISLVREYNKRPIDIAICHGYVDIVRLLVETHGVNVNLEGTEFCSALFWAIQSGSLQMVDYLVNAGAYLAGALSLHTAIELDKHAICRYMISRGVDVNVKNSLGLTPLASAVSLRRNFIAHVLLDAGSTIDGVFTRGNRLIHFVVISGSLGILKRLCSLGADVNIQNKYGNTPLHIAALYGFYDIVHYLTVDKNVVMDMRDIDGQTPFAMAVNQGNTRISKLLVHLGYFPSRQECDNLRLLNSPSCSELQCLMHVVFNPRTLKELCIFILRRFLGNDLAGKVSNLQAMLGLDELQLRDIILTKIT